MNGTRLFVMAACTTWLGCSSSTEATAPIANEDTGAAETSSVLDSNAEPIDAAVDDTAIVVDGTPADTTPTKKSALVRIFDGLDGAAIYVCSKGLKIGDSYDRTGASGSIASGYIETTTYGSFKVHAQATTAPSCAPDGSSDPSYSLSEGSVKTLFVRAITGFNGILSVTDDLTAPASGKARVRVFNGATAFTTTHGLLDVCAGGVAWATGLAAALASPYQEAAPGVASVEVRTAATPACSGGTVLGTVSVTSLANATHTLFLVDGKGAGAKTHISFCTDATGGLPSKAAACTDTAF